MALRFIAFSCLCHSQFHKHSRGFRGFLLKQQTVICHFLRFLVLLSEVLNWRIILVVCGQKPVLLRWQNPNYRITITMCTERSDPAERDSTARMLMKKLQPFVAAKREKGGYWAEPHASICCQIVTQAKEGCHFLCGHEIQVKDSVLLPCQPWYEVT